jgi:hypothetical protein
MRLIDVRLAVDFGCKCVKSLSPAAILGLRWRNGLLDGGDGGGDGLCRTCNRDWLVCVVGVDFVESGAVGLGAVWHSVEVLRGDTSIV